MFGKKKGSSSQGLHIIIVGCGKVGSALTEQLTKEGHDITIIDTDAERIQELTGYFDIMGMTGNGASHTVQLEAGIENADLIIAVTGSDELNLLCCTIAKQVGNCAAIARVRTPDYSKEVGYLQQKLGLAMIINPELEAAREVARLLLLPTALEVNSFAHGQAELIKIKVPEDNILDGMTIATFGRESKLNALICAIEREGEVVIPSGDFQMRQGDTISFVAHKNAVKSFMNYIGFKTNQVKNTMIIGGGKGAYYLATQLINMGIDVKIIESNRERCEELSILLPKAVIINADGSSREVLEEEGIQDVDSLVPLTGIDEENIMLTLYARQISTAKVITKINRMTFKSVISTLDLGSVVYPRYITSESIIAYVRARKASRNSNIETLYHMFDEKAEAIEFRVNKSSKITNIPLMDLNLKKDLLISFINRKGRIILPSGKDSIHAGDTVMIVTTHTGFNDIQDIIE